MLRLSSDKKIAILGAGAVGSFYGGILARSGFDVTFIAKGRQLEAFKQSGLTIKSYKYGTFNLKIKAAPQLEGNYDIIIVATKSEDTEKACRNINEHLSKQGCVVSFQNGVDNIKTIQQFTDISRIIPACIYVGLTVESPGTVVHSAEGLITFGPVAETDIAYINILKGIFDKAGLDYKVDDNILLAQWKKLLWNLAFNPLSAILEATCGQLYGNHSIRTLMGKIIDEGVRAASKEGIQIPSQYVSAVPDSAKNLKNFKTSMFQDIQKGKSPEIDGIIKPVIDRLESAPYCETLYSILAFKYGGKFIYTPKLTVDMIVENDKSEILLIKRKNPPHGWALPGGFVDYGEKVESAAVRELAEETNIIVNTEEINLLGVYSDPARDPRGHTTSIVYYVISSHKPKAADDAAETAFFEKDKLPSEIVFDHKQILSDYFRKKHHVDN